MRLRRSNENPFRGYITLDHRFSVLHFAYPARTWLAYPTLIRSQNGGLVRPCVEANLILDEFYPFDALRRALRRKSLARCRHTPPEINRAILYRHAYSPQSAIVDRLFNLHRQLAVCNDRLIARQTSRRRRG